jgi:hypothetical protein
MPAHRWNFCEGQHATAIEKDAFRCIFTAFQMQHLQLEETEKVFLLPELCVQTGRNRTSIPNRICQ